MNGRNARKRMENKIRTTIFRKQRKTANRLAFQDLSLELRRKFSDAVLNMRWYDRLRYVFTGKINHVFISDNVE